MTEARIGRLLPACLHDAIAERLPQRLEFYEHWLTPDGLREGSIGLAPMTAVLGFLRTEGEAYDAVTTRAGELAAAWSIMSLPSGRARRIAWLPRFWRTRSALRIAADIVHDIEGTRRTAARVRRHTARLELPEALFCAVRARSSAPLCGFYVAVAVETLRQFGIAAVGRSDRCRAVEGTTCTLVFDLGDAARQPAGSVA
jgi:hypothetical protein